MKILNLFLMSNLLMFTAGCATVATEESLQAQGLSPLSAEQMLEIFPGNTGVGQRVGGNPFTVHFREDGTQSAFASTGTGRSSDTGFWEISENGEWCSWWNNWRNGQRACSRYYQVDEQFLFFNQNGRGSFKLVQGNPHNL